MPPSTITTSGTQSPLVSSALSYPQNADPTTYLPYSSPQILISSGTWRHPKPGFAISINYAVFGGGGGGTDRSEAGTSGAGGGSGRITFVTATVTTDLAVTIGAGGALGAGTDGGTGGSTIFNATTAAGGSGGVETGAGGAGGFGGGGSIYIGTPYAGGAGLDYVGGSGAFATTSANPGSSASVQNATSGTSNLLPGWPNGTTGLTGLRALGGNPLLLFPWCQGYGAGGSGRGHNGTNAGSVGKQGAIFIWYNRP